MRYNLILLKLTVIALCFACLYFELKTYNNLVGSIGEYALLDYKENMHTVAYTLLGIPSAIWVFSTNRILSYFMIAIMIVVVLFFYPVFDMTDVEHPL